MVKEGGKSSEEEEATQRAREPVVCPPRPSRTVTVSRQLLHRPAGREEGTKEAELEEELVQVPGQEDSHWKERESPLESEAETETEVDWPTSSLLREAETEETEGQKLKEMSREAAPLEAPETTLMARERETAEPWESVTVRVRV